MADIAVISSENDLWDWLERLQGVYDNSARGLVPADLFHVSWSPELLYLPEGPLGHVISPSMARALTGFHRSLSRAYAYVVYGRADARVLHTEDMRALDLKVLVIEGSTGLKICEEAINSLIKGLVGKMTPRQITFTVIIFLILFFSASVGKEWIKSSYDAKKHEHDSHERIELSAQETKRAQILADALSRHPNLRPIAALANESKEPLVKSVVDSNHARIVGADITADQARVILDKPKERGVGRKLDGDYEVIEVDVDNPDGWMGRLRNSKTGQEFSVSINQGELTQDDIDVMFTSVRDKKTIHALVNAWFLGGETPVTASIVRATALP